MCEALKTYIITSSRHKNGLKQAHMKVSGIWWNLSQTNAPVILLSIGIPYNALWQRVDPGILKELRNLPKKYQSLFKCTWSVSI